MDSKWGELQKAEPLAPDQLAEVAPGQQGEGARTQAGTDIKALHDLAVARNIVERERSERTEQACQRDRHKQVDPGVAGPVGQLVVTDKHGADGGSQHHRDPGVAGRAVYAGALCAAAPGPDGKRPDQQCGECSGQMNSNDGCEWHGGGVVGWRWRDCAACAITCPPVCDGMHPRRCEMQRHGVSGGWRVAKGPPRSGQGPLGG